MALDSPPNDPPPPPLPQPVRRLAQRLALVVSIVLVVLLVGFAVIAPHITLNEYSISPGTAQSVGPLIRVPASRTHQLHGQILLTDVLISTGPVTAFDWPFDKLQPDTAFLPANEIQEPGVPSSEQEAQGFLEMQQSQTWAPAVALNRLGYRVSEHSDGTVVVAVHSKTPAASVLSVGETVKAIDGQATPFPCSLTAALANKEPGDRVSLTIEESSINSNAEFIAGKTVIRSAVLARPPSGLGPSGCPGTKGAPKAFLGVDVEARQYYSFPFPVTISTQNIGGPSAGLAMTLGIIDKLSGGSLTGGLTVAATGAIDPAGDVCEVGGVPQKTIAVERAGATVFLVPPGNYQDAMSKDTPPLRVYAVSTLNQALRVLRRLGGKIPAVPRSDPQAGSGIANGCAIYGQ